MAPPLPLPTVKHLDSPFPRGILRAMFTNSFTLTKRLLGLLMLIGGIVAFGGIIAIDIIDVGREGGIGPAQQIALGGCVLIALVGLTLIPLGDHPA